jgi:hypothetical protein
MQILAVNIPEPVVLAWLVILTVGTLAFSISVFFERKKQ